MKPLYILTFFRRSAPPEYKSRHEKFSVIYSYGIFLLEIITGRKYNED
jgi:hypothetical protein